MTTVARRNSELLYNPVVLIQMKETAYGIATYLKAEDEVLREGFAKKLLITFILIEERRMKTSPITLWSTFECLDTTKDGFEDIFEQYAWFCGYAVVWNKESVVIES
jgi:hypothetical protein